MGGSIAIAAHRALHPSAQLTAGCDTSGLAPSTFKPRSQALYPSAPSLSKPFASVYTSMMYAAPFSKATVLLKGNDPHDRKDTYDSIAALALHDLIAYNALRPEARPLYNSSSWKRTLSPSGHFSVICNVLKHVSLRMCHLDNLSKAAAEAT
eukprot:6467683-Amphidinium_carterae.2